jgi:hypothetical protein
LRTNEEGLNMNKKFLVMSLLAFVLTIAILMVWADETTLTPTTIPASHATAGATLGWTVADTVLNNQFLSTGREILLVRSDSADTHTVTVTSVADKYGRTGDTSKALVAGTYAVFQQFPTHGWQASDGYIVVSTDTDLIYYSVIRVP